VPANAKRGHTHAAVNAGIERYGSDHLRSLSIKKYRFFLIFSCVSNTLPYILRTRRLFVKPVAAQFIHFFFTCFTSKKPKTQKNGPQRQSAATRLQAMSRRHIAGYFGETNGLLGAATVVYLPRIN
jgi:hypothetical protein